MIFVLFIPSREHTMIISPNKHNDSMYDIVSLSIEVTNIQTPMSHKIAPITINSAVGITCSSLLV